MDTVHLSGNIINISELPFHVENWYRHFRLSLWNTAQSSEIRNHIVQDLKWRSQRLTGDFEVININITFSKFLFRYSPSLWTTDKRRCLYINKARIAKPRPAEMSIKKTRPADILYIFTILNITTSSNTRDIPTIVVIVSEKLMYFFFHFTMLGCQLQYSSLALIFRGQLKMFDKCQLRDAHFLSNRLERVIFRIPVSSSPKLYSFSTPIPALLIFLLHFPRNARF